MDILNKEIEKIDNEIRKNFMVIYILVMSLIGMFLSTYWYFSSIDVNNITENITSEYNVIIIFFIFVSLLLMILDAIMGIWEDNIKLKRRKEAVIREIKEKK